MNKIERMIKENTLCVLATEGEGKPYCSLMTYMPDEELRMLYMVTTLDSKKFNNMANNSNVSVLVDNRQYLKGNKGEQILSITFEGTYARVAQDLVEQIRGQFSERHPELVELFRNPECVVFGIKLYSYLLLNGPFVYEQGIL